MNRELTNTKTGYKKTKLGLIPEEWSISRLGEFYDFKNGLNKGKEFFGYGTPIINYMDVYNETFLTANKIDGLVSLNKSELERFNVKKGDVFFTRTSETINDIAYSSVLLEDIENGVFSGFILRARPNNNNKIDLGFAQYCFSTYLARKEIISKSSFTTRALTNGRFLSEVNLLLPPILEQQKIAKILSTWDTAIQKHEQLIAAKETFKKGLMQVLLTGKKRFEGFEGEWKEQAIGSFGGVVSGLTYSPDDVKEGGVLVLRSSNVQNRKLKFNDNVYVDVKEGRYNPLKKNDILICVRNGSKKLIGKNAIIDTKTEGKAFGAFMSVFRSERNEYMFHLFDTDFYKKEIHKNLGATINSINGGNLKKFKFPFPKEKERKKITEVLNGLETELKLLEHQLEQLKNQQQGLMQQLLTGAVRVKINKK